MVVYTLCRAVTRHAFSELFCLVLSLIVLVNWYTKVTGQHNVFLLLALGTRTYMLSSPVPTGYAICFSASQHTINTSMADFLYPLVKLLFFHKAAEVFKIFQLHAQ